MEPPKFREAITCFEKALEILKSWNSKETVAEIWLCLAHALIKERKLDKAT